MATLTEIYSDVLATVYAFRAASNAERPDYETLRADLMSMLSEAKRAVEDERLDPREYAHYAVVALVDETIMVSDWEGAEQWRRETLQMAYFGRFLAGEQVFQQLDELMAGSDADLLEVHFHCLCAGFRGMYRDDPNALQSRRRKLYQQLSKIDLRETPHLTEEAYGRNLQRDFLHSSFPFWWLLPFVLGGAALYAAFYFVLVQQVGEIVELAS